MAVGCTFMTFDRFLHQLLPICSFSNTQPEAEPVDSYALLRKPLCHFAVMPSLAAGCVSQPSPGHVHRHTVSASMFAAPQDADCSALIMHLRDKTRTLAIFAIASDTPQPAIAIVFATDVPGHPWDHIPPTPPPPIAPSRACSSILARSCRHDDDGATHLWTGGGPRHARCLGIPC